jgi:hypothetical protein
VRITFYSVRADSDRFQYLLEDGADAPRYDFDGTTKAAEWLPPPVFSHKPKLPEGDFWNLNLLSEAFAVRPEALERTNVEYYLRGAGELLPLPYGDRVFRVLNVTECYDALDKDATRWDDLSVDLEPELREQVGPVLVVREPVFRTDRLGWQLFKVPEQSTRIYYWEAEEDAPEQFRSYVEWNGLTGLLFEPLYTVET